jgi:hypothetical protein
MHYWNSINKMELQPARDNAGWKPSDYKRNEEENVEIKKISTSR